MKDLDWSLAWRGFLTVALLLAVGISIWLLSQFEIPETNREIAWILFGVIATQTTTALNWWFSSSKGSSDKTKLLNGGP